MSHFLALLLIRGSSSQMRVEVDIDVASDEHVEVERGFQDRELFYGARRNPL